MSIRPRFYRFRFPEATPRYSIGGRSNDCTRHINVEVGKRLFQVVWTRKRHLAAVKRINMAAR